MDFNEGRHCYRLRLSTRDWPEITRALTEKGCNVVGR